MTPARPRAASSRIRPLLAAAALLAAGAASAQIGFTQMQAAGLPVVLVYPTAAQASPQTFGPFTIDVAPDAVPAAGARRRLVVISHGTGGSALADHTLARTFAAAGFVVAQPLHAGDNFADMSKAGPAAWQTRPVEVSRVIDALAAHPAWGPRLALDRVGVHGMSAGGVTALSLAGAQWRIADLVAHCNAHPDDDGFCFNGATESSARAQRAAAFERARGVPSAHLPAEMVQRHGGRDPDATDRDPRPDRRIAAVTLAVPVAAIFSADSLSRIEVPVGVVSADGDQVLRPAYHSAHVLRHCTRCTPLVDLRGAGHFDVLHPWPAAVADAVGRAQVRGGFPTPGFDPAARADAAARVVDFHRRHLSAP